MKGILLRFFWGLLLFVIELGVVIVGVLLWFKSLLFGFRLLLFLVKVCDGFLKVFWKDSLMFMLNNIKIVIKKCINFIIYYFGG